MATKKLKVQWHEGKGEREPLQINETNQDQGVLETAMKMSKEI